MTISHTRSEIHGGRSNRKGDLVGSAKSESLAALSRSKSALSGAKQAWIIVLSLLMVAALGTAFAFAFKSPQLRNWVGLGSTLAADLSSSSNDDAHGHAPGETCNDDHTAAVTSAEDHVETGACAHDHSAAETCTDDHAEGDTCDHDHGSDQACDHDHSAAETCTDDHAEGDTCDHDHGTDQACDDDHSAAAAADHKQPGNLATASLSLSPQARSNIGLELIQIELRDFERTITIPAKVVERAGRSRITVSAPMTGIITRIYPIEGEAVVPNQRLFDLRLTHEDVVEKQSALLRDLEQLDVIQREVTRLEEVTRSGAVAGKTLLDRLYEKQTLEAAIRAERQALVLHGFSSEQIATIVDQRELLQNMSISAPQRSHLAEDDRHDSIFQLEFLSVKQGDHVTAGTPLAVVADHCELYIEGQAFEHDAAILNRALKQNQVLSAVLEPDGSDDRTIPGLKMLYIKNRVEMESRALRFYVGLPNELVRNELTPDGHHFIGWKYRPGQRVDLRVPTEQWKGQIVLPADAVVREGVESYVFRQNGEHFDRRPVHVEYRDRRFAVIESDGSLTPGDIVAGKGAYQIHLALKNQSGAGVDPHAGHNH